MNRDTAIAAVQTLHEFLRASRPQWTHELPTREGFYWVRESKRGDEIVVRVKVDYSEANTPFVVQSGHPEDQGVSYLSEYGGYQWAGPIEKPQG